MNIVTASFTTVRQMTECFSDQFVSAKNDRNVSEKKTNKMGVWSAWAEAQATSVSS